MFPAAGLKIRHELVLSLFSVPFNDVDDGVPLFLTRSLANRNRSSSMIISSSSLNSKSGIFGVKIEVWSGSATRFNCSINLSPARVGPCCCSACCCACWVAACMTSFFIINSSSVSNTGRSWSGSAGPSTGVAILRASFMAMSVSMASVKLSRAADVVFRSSPIICPMSRDSCINCLGPKTNHPTAIITSTSGAPTPKNPPPPNTIVGRRFIVDARMVIGSEMP